MRFVIKHILVIVLFLGLFIRLLVLFDDYSFDVNNHIAWAKDLHQRGFANFYDTQSSEVYASFYPNYPPLAMYMFYLTYPLPELIHNVLWWLNIHIPLFPSKLMLVPTSARFFLAAMMKIPAIAADFGIAWMVYLFVKRLKINDLQKKKLLILGPALVLLNPAFFYNSAYWGQIDAIPIFFVLVSLYVLLYGKKYVISGLFFTAALLIKPTALVFLPVYGATLIRPGLIKVAPFLAGNLLFIAAFFPLLGKQNSILGPYNIYFHRIMEAQSISFATNGAFNIWAIITHLERINDTEKFIVGFTYNQWGLMMAGITIAVLCVKMWKHTQTKIKTEDNMWLALFLSALACFLFLTKMHERYTMLILPFLLLLSLKSKNLMKWFVIFSLFSFLNLYHSWPVPHIEALQKTLKAPLVYSSIALAQLLLFFHFLRNFLQKQKA